MNTDDVETVDRAPTTSDRRRIAVLIAVLAIVLAWWSWTRVDQRFLGQWVRAVPNGFADHVYVFHADGTGSLGSGGVGETAFRWKVSGSNLKLIYGQQSGFDGFVDRLKHLSGRPSLMYDGQTYSVAEVTTDRMVWRMVSPGQRITAEDNDAFEVRRVK
jgi:hypothetical protein